MSAVSERRAIGHGRKPHPLLDTPEPRILLFGLCSFRLFFLFRFFVNPVTCDGVARREAGEGGRGGLKEAEVIQGSGGHGRETLSTVFFSTRVAVFFCATQ